MRLRRSFLTLSAICLVAACAPRLAPADEAEARLAASRMVEVTARVEPVAERICAARAPQLDCDVEFLVDVNPAAPPNAFQTNGRDGRALIVVTAPLILAARNPDELAFILAHEVSHHIENHITRQRSNARMGAAVMGQMAGLADASVGREAVAFGAVVGARTYAKTFELEADRLGTLITAQAGYDPLRGAEFFFRIPDPGNVFLGTHPPNADRVKAVRQAAAAL